MAKTAQGRTNFLIVHIPYKRIHHTTAQSQCYTSRTISDTFIFPPFPGKYVCIRHLCQNAYQNEYSKTYLQNHKNVTIGIRGSKWRSGIAIYSAVTSGKSKHPYKTPAKRKLVTRLQKSILSNKDYIIIIFSIKYRFL